jgi:putative ABC transport system permease protein
LFNCFATSQSLFLPLVRISHFYRRIQNKRNWRGKRVGASIGSIVGLLSKDFLKLVIIATAIAFPIAWWALHKMLEDYAYRTNLSWWVFALAGAGAIFIALVTISFQAIKTAMSSPVKSLRSE